MKPIQNISKDPIAREGVQEASNPEFTEASTRENIVSEESLPTLFGKIKKFFSDLKTVAFTNDYTDLDNKPTIPAAQIQSDWNQTITTARDYIKNKPTIPAAQVQTDWNATSGMGVLLNKPTIPAAQVNADWNASSGVAKILNKPTIPTVNNATLTIQKNGTTVKTFTANASSNVTCNITMTKSDVGLGNVDNTADASKSVNYANSAGSAPANGGTSAACSGNSATATTAAKLGRGGNTGVPMTFNWSGQGGQPTWLWGGEDGTNMYVYSPANFSVNYAASSGYANSAGSAPANGGNSDTVDGSHAWQMQSLSSAGQTHGSGDWVVICQHNLDGDGRFKFRVGNGSIDSKVDYANKANTVSATSQYPNGGNDATKCPVYIYAPASGNASPAIGFSKQGGSYSLILYMTVTGDLYARWNDGTEKKIIGH